MERPTMKESLKGYSLEEAHKLYTDCPELYRHIVKLDEYIDYLEDKLNNLVIVDVVVPNDTNCTHTFGVDLNTDKAKKYRCEQMAKVLKAPSKIYLYDGDNYIELKP